MINTLELLRAETQKDHKTTEADSFMKNFFAPDLSLENYKRALTNLAQVLVPIERALRSSPLLLQFPSVQNRPTEILLLQDLEKFGEISFQFGTLPKFETRTDLVGALYVIEGAANGGKIIFNRLRAASDLRFQDRSSYFEYQAQSQSDRWAQFKNELSGLDLTPAENEQAILSAKKIFRMFVL